MSDNDTHKPKRVRSPAYPAIDLETAIQRVKTIYGHEKKSAAPVAVVSSHCGPDIKSSAGMRLIAALKQFSFVVEEGSGEDRQVRLSERALDIEFAESLDSPDRLESIKKAAMAPKIHKKIWDHYKGALPSDKTLRVHLIRKLDFNDATVDGFIKQFRSTIKFAKLEESDIIEDAIESDEEERVDNGVQLIGHSRGGQVVAQLATQHQNFVKGSTSSRMRELPITLPSLNIAVVTVPERMTELDFTTLTKTIEAWKSALVVSDPVQNTIDQNDEPEPDLDSI